MLFSLHDRGRDRHRANLATLRTIAPTRSKQKIELFLEYGDQYHGQEIPDPYAGIEMDFQVAFDVIEDGCKGAG